MADETHVPESPIPKAWRSTVATILRSHDPDAIITSQQSDRDWFAAFPASWHFERFEAMATALDLPINGRQVFDMDEPGEVWAFWFGFSDRTLYAKINLLPDGKVIIIYSSHSPRKGGVRL